MNATDLLQNLRRVLLGKQAQSTPAEALAKAQTDLAALTAEASSADLRAIAAQLTSLAETLEPATPAEKTDVTKAELDAYTAARTTMSTIYDAAYGMSDALRAMDMTKFSGCSAMLQAAVASVTAFASALGGGEAAAPAADAPAAEDATVTANAKSEDKTMTRDEFIAWAVSQIEEAKKADTVEKATAIISAVAKGVAVAKLAFVDNAGPTMSVDWMEAYPGTGGPGASKMDVTARTDQSASDGNAVKATDGTAGDTAFAMNAGAVLKALEELIAKQATTPVAKAEGDGFVWPMDMNGAAVEEERAPVVKTEGDGGWGNDPWKPAPSFPAVR